MNKKRVLYFKPEKLMILSPEYGEERFILAYVKMAKMYSTYTNYRVSRVVKMSSNYIFYEKSGRFANKVFNNKPILPFLNYRQKDIMEVNELPDKDVELFYEINNLGGVIDG